MSFFKKLKGELIDIIEFLDNTQNTLVYRFERHNNEIKNNAKLVVREGQTAVFINEGQLADVFLPGTYTLNTENLPILSTLKGWKYGFKSPFKAEVYFVSTKNFIDQKWGTKNPIILNDTRFGMIEMRAFGVYTFKITDASKFIREIVGSNQLMSTQQIQEQLRSIIVTRFSDAAGELNLPIEQYASNLNELSVEVYNYMNNDFYVYGLEVTKFLIENISMPEEVKKEIFELSRLGNIDLDGYTKLKAAKALETAAENPGGVAGIGVGLGAGAMMAKEFSKSLTKDDKSQTAPPPLPSVKHYYLAINGEQIGPIEMNRISVLAHERKIDIDTLVWTKGMSGWDKLENVEELNSLISNVPPVLPEK